MRHMVPMATGAIIMGIMNREVTIRAHILSEQRIMASIRPRTTSSVTEITANRMVFRVLVWSRLSVNIRM